VQTSRKPAAEAYAFFDYARVSNRDRLFVDTSSRDLSSAGAGVRVSFDRFRLDSAIAIPLQRVGLLNEKPDPRVLISLTTRLWPGSF
jgi:hemolysin activation/secretion protein